MMKRASDALNGNFFLHRISKKNPAIAGLGFLCILFLTIHTQTTPCPFIAKEVKVKAKKIGKKNGAHSHFHKFDCNISLLFTNKQAFKKMMWKKTTIVGINKKKL